MTISKILLMVFAILFTSSYVKANEEFPGRKKYPRVKIYDIKQLHTEMSKVVIVDARSKLEFETLRIENAINIPVSAKTFEKQITELRSKTKKPIVFYCNGHTCFKSYIAARKSRKAKVDNVFAYDAGLKAWANTYPTKSILLGENLKSKNQIISDKAFKQRLLEPNEFSKRAFKAGNKGIILDVRDKYQRGAAGFFPGQEKWTSLNEREQLQDIINKVAKQKHTLFIYDEVGKQVRWLQYALEQASVKNYYFMKKGAKGYYKQMMKEFGISTTRM